VVGDKAHIAPKGAEGEKTIKTGTKNIEMISFHVI
jgi:hypothetical protein